MNKSKKQKLERLLERAVEQENGDRVRDIVNLITADAKKYGSIGTFYLKKLLKDDNKYLVGAVSSAYAMITGDIKQLFDTEYGGLGWNFQKTPIYGGINHHYSDGLGKKLYLNPQMFKFSKSIKEFDLSLERTLEGKRNENRTQRIEKGDFLNRLGLRKEDSSYSLIDRIKKDSKDEILSIGDFKRYMRWLVETSLEKTATINTVFGTLKEELGSLNLTVQSYGNDAVEIRTSLPSPLSCFNNPGEKYVPYGPFSIPVNEWKPVKNPKNDPKKASNLDSSTIVITRLKEEFDKLYSGKYTMILQGKGSYNERTVLLEKKYSEKKIEGWIRDNFNLDNSQSIHLSEIIKKKDIIEEYTSRTQEDFLKFYDAIVYMHKKLQKNQDKLASKIYILESEHKKRIEDTIGAIF